MLKYNVKQGKSSYRTLSAFFIVIFLLFSIFCGSVNAETYYLDAVNGDDGNPGTDELPWKTLTKAQLLVNDGDTVYLYSGDYGVFSDMSGDTHSNWITYRGVPGHTPSFEVIRVWNASTTDKYLRFIDITIKADKAHESDGRNGFIQIWKSNHIEIVKCNVLGYGYTFKNPGDGSLVPEIYTRGIMLEACGSVTVDDCNIVGASGELSSGFGYSIYMDNVNDVNVTNCLISFNFDGIKIDGTNIAVTRNNICHMDNDGILIGECNNVDVSYNHIHDLVRPNGSVTTSMDFIQGQYAASHNVVLRGNHCHGGDTQGFFINLNGGSYWTIENNLVYDAWRLSSEGRVCEIKGSCTGSTIIRNNTIDGYLYIGGDRSVTVTGNACKRFYIDVNGDQGDATSVTLENWNYITQNLNGGYSIGVASVDVGDDEDWDAMFENVYMPTATSVLLDIIPSASAPTTDRNQNGRYDYPDQGGTGSTICDIGCNERWIKYILFYRST